MTLTEAIKIFKKKGVIEVSLHLARAMMPDLQPLQDRGWHIFLTIKADELDPDREWRGYAPDDTVLIEVDPRSPAFYPLPTSIIAQEI